MTTKRLQAALPLTVIFLILALFTHWAGTAKSGALFGAGVALQLVIIAVFGALIWHFLLAPMSGKPIAPRPMPLSARYLLAPLAAICGIMFVVGGVWDGTWHMKYGIPFGEDFFWRPHLMLYAGFLLIGLFAFAGLIYIFRAGSGTLRQRFRQYPSIGLLVFVSGFVLVATPLDPVWHVIYGTDLSAWSLPHLVLAVGFMAVMIVAAIVQTVNFPPKAVWSDIRHVAYADLIAAIPLVFSLFITLFIGAVEWLNVAPAASRADWFNQRPEWLYPILLIGVATFFGVFGVNLRRKVGFATLIGVGAAVTHLAAVAIVGEFMPANTTLLVLLEMVGIDVAYLIAQRQGWQRTRAALAAGFGGALLMSIIGLPIIGATMGYPAVTGATVPGMVVFGLLTGLAAAWYAAALLQQVASVLVPVPEAAPAVEKRVNPAYRYAPAALLIALAAFMLFFITTATPPV